MPLVSTEVQTSPCELLLPESEGHINNRKSFEKLTLYNSYSRPREFFMSKGIKKCLYLLGIATILSGVGIVYHGYYCPETVCAFNSISKNKYGFMKYNNIDNFHLDNDRIGKPLADSDRSETGPAFEEVVGKDFLFNIEGHDVIVFLHIQKTGGTVFGKHLASILKYKFELFILNKIDWY